MTSWLANTRIAIKMMITLALLGLVAIGMALTNAVSLRGIDSRYTSMINSDLPATVQLVRVNRIAVEMVKDAYASATYLPGSQAGRRSAAKIEKADANALAALDTAQRLDPDVGDHAGKLRADIQAIHDKSREAAERAAAGQADAARAALAAADDQLERLSVTMRSFNDGRIARADAQSHDLAATTATVVLTELLLSVLATAAVLALAYWVVSRGVVTPVKNMAGNMFRLVAGERDFEVPCAQRRDEFGRMGEALLAFRDAAREQVRMQAAKEQADSEQKVVVDTLNDQLARLAGGDLTAEVRTDFAGDYAALKTNFNAAVEQLRGLISSVIVSAEQLRTGSIEIAQASEDLARRTEGNAASLEQTAAGVQQMDGRLKATASAANDTVQRADQTKVTVASGRSVADQAVQAMVRVSDSAKGIDSVIEGLDKIAFQTRVLAMNAAVEAGRAGEAGRGFAVVADLVSALAMRAEEEAKRARDQLTVTQADVVTAVEAVEKVDGALANISGDVEQVHSLLATIAADNQAQAAAITEINAAVASMDQATQQNAAMVEETSAAARNLLAEVNALSEQAGQFTTGAPNTRTPRLPRVGKEGAFAQPVRALPTHAVAALTPPSDADDWREF